MYVGEVPDRGTVQAAPVNHWYVDGPLPPAGWAVSVIDCPLSMDGDDDGVIAPALNAARTVTVSPAAHRVSGVPLLSLILAEYVPADDAE